MGFLRQLVREFEGNKGESDHILTNLVEAPQIETLIGIPSWAGSVEPDTQQCLDHLIHYNLQAKRKIIVRKPTSSLIGENRNLCIKEAIEKGAEYVLFIDTDMIFPPDAIQRLQMHNKPIVSAVAVTKGYPYKPNLYKKISDVGWTPIIRGLAGGHLLKVDCVGGAFMLIRVKDIKDIPPPWFAQPPVLQHVIWDEVRRLWDEQGVNQKEVCEKIVNLYRMHRKQEASLGEDYYFSEVLRRHDVPIYVDTGLKIGHIGKYIFKYEDFAAQLESGALDKHIQAEGDEDDNGSGPDEADSDAA
jgi:glycosyltransferase involved in cell wall biosynthesis